MRANLAYIDSAVHTGLERELESPKVSAAAKSQAEQAKIRVVAGFVLNDDAEAARVIEASRQERKHAVQRYKDDRAAVTEKLSKLGITPKAILPATAWERICTQAKLYRLSPNKDGTVNVALRDKLRALEVWGWILAIGLTITYVLLTSALGGYLVSQTSPSTVVKVAKGGSIGAFVAAIPLLLVWTFGDNTAMERTAAAITVVLMWLYRLKPHSAILRDYFPDGVSPSNTWSTTRATLVLPAPPKDVAEMLCKAKNLDLKVAAVGKAISFLETPRKILKEEHNARIRARIQAREEERARLKHDPIIYHQHGSAVAVLDQFGDFPIEKKIVDEVVNSEHLI